MIHIVQNAEVKSIKLGGLKKENVLDFQNIDLDEVRYAVLVNNQKNLALKMRVDARNAKVIQKNYLEQKKEKSWEWPNLVLEESLNVVDVVDQKNESRQVIVTNAKIIPNVREESQKYWKKILLLMNEKKLMSDIKMIQNSHLKSLYGRLLIGISSLAFSLKNHVKYAETKRSTHTMMIMQNLYQLGGFVGSIIMSIIAMNLKFRR